MSDGPLVCRPRLPAQPELGLEGEAGELFPRRACLACGSRETEETVYAGTEVSVPADRSARKARDWTSEKRRPVLRTLFKCRACGLSPVDEDGQNGLWGRW